MRKNWINGRSKFNNIAWCIANLFDCLGVNHTMDKIAEALESHPEYPSLFAISDVLSEWGVKTEPVRGSIAHLTNQDFPSIAHTKFDEIIVLKEISNNQVMVYNSQKGNFSLTLEDFDNIWSGIILRAFPEKNAGEKNYKSNYRKELIRNLITPFSLSGIILFVWIAFLKGLIHQSDYLLPLLLGITYMTGWVLCAIMLSRNLVNSTLLNKLCRHTKKMNCEGVMNSKAGKIFGIPMADLGLLYFSGSFFSLMLYVNSNQAETGLFLLGVIAISTLPYTFFSITYQALILRNWCWMCVMVMILFWVDFLLLLDTIGRGWHINNIWVFFPLLMGFCLPALIWLIVRPMILLSTKTKKLEMEARRYRQDPVFIEAKLSQAPEIDMALFPFELEMGAKEAKRIITLVIHPTCIYCFKAYKELGDIISSNHRLIKARIRFAVWMPDPEEHKKIDVKTLNKLQSQGIYSKVITTVLSYLVKGDHEKALESLNEWFATEDRSEEKYKRWQLKYSLICDENLKEVKDLMRMHHKWCNQSGVIGTPSVFFNNRLLPSIFSISDLKLFALRQIEKSEQG